MSTRWTGRGMRRAVELLEARGAATIPHPGGILLAHLQRVVDLLERWGAQPHVQLAGLCHAAYGTDGFPTALLDLAERATLAAVVGDEAEALVYRYGSCDRAVLYPQLGRSERPRFRDRFSGAEDEPEPAELAAFVELTFANELDIARQSADFVTEHGTGLYGLFARCRPLASAAAWAECERVLGSGRVTAGPRAAPFAGTGPGEITPDGCAVEAWSLLPPAGEPDIVHAAVPAGATILELGSGPGRHTYPLVALGHEVVAVDESEAMLARLRERASAAGSAVPETVCNPIETLDLRRRFDVVLLASVLINTPEPEVCRAMLAACRRHVRPDGCVLIQRRPPGWPDGARAGERVAGDLVIRSTEPQPAGAGRYAVTTEILSGTRTWTHTFTVRPLDDDQLGAQLAAAGLRVDRYLTADRTWVRAVPQAHPVA
jgi:SAM-dependent methyltransferase